MIYLKYVFGALKDLQVTKSNIELYIHLLLFSLWYYFIDDLNCNEISLALNNTGLIASIQFSENKDSDEEKHNIVSAIIYTTDDRSSIDVSIHKDITLLNIDDNDKSFKNIRAEGKLCSRAPTVSKIISSTTSNN